MYAQAHTNGDHARMFLYVEHDPLLFPKMSDRKRIHQPVKTIAIYQQLIVLMETIGLKGTCCTT